MYKKVHQNPKLCNIARERIDFSTDLFKGIGIRSY